MDAAARRRCKTAITVRPSPNRASVPFIAASVAGSKALVASSKSNKRGSRRIARAIAIRWRWPPDKQPPPNPTGVFKP